VKVRDVVIAMTSSTISTPSAGVFREMNFAPCADYGLLERAVAAARAKGTRFHVGGIHSSDAFYDERPDLMEALKRHGVLAVEMEAAELYTVAARHGARALAVLTVSDHLITGEALPSEDRERSFGEMVEIALEAALGYAVSQAVTRPAADFGRCGRTDQSRRVRPRTTFSANGATSAPLSRCCATGAEWPISTPAPLIVSSTASA